MSLAALKCMIPYKMKVIGFLNLEYLVNYWNQLWKVFLNCFCLFQIHI